MKSNRIKFYYFQFSTKDNRKAQILRFTLNCYLLYTLLWFVFIFAQCKLFSLLNCSNLNKDKKTTNLINSNLAT
jgi:hypothetical protein